MLAGTAMAEPERLALSAPATSSQALALREEMATLAPCSARRWAIALPMPLVDPVTTATLPVRSKSSGSLVRVSVAMADIWRAPLNARLICRAPLGEAVVASSAQRQRLQGPMSR